MIESLADGDGIPVATGKAGFTDVVREVLPRILTPKARQYVRNSVRGRIDVEASPEAYRALVRILRDAKAPMGMRIDVAKFFISHSIAAPKALEEDNGHEKNPSEMTNDELRASLAKSDAELARRNMVIDVTPTQAIDDII